MFCELASVRTPPGRAAKRRVKGRGWGVNAGDWVGDGGLSFGEGGGGLGRRRKLFTKKYLAVPVSQLRGSRRSTTQAPACMDGRMVDGWE